MSPPIETNAAADTAQLAAPATTPDSGATRTFAGRDRRPRVDEVRTRICVPDGLFPLIIRAGDPPGWESASAMPGEGAPTKPGIDQPSGAETSPVRRETIGGIFADEMRRVVFQRSFARRRCSHFGDQGAIPGTPLACSACEPGARWAHLRMCLTCGSVGCCDSSPGLHAVGHFKESGHPVIRSIEPGEAWAWCYVDRAYLTLRNAA